MGTLLHQSASFFFSQSRVKSAIRKIVHDSVRWRGMILMQLGHSIKRVLNSNGQPYYRVDSSIQPQYRVSMDSSSFDLYMLTFYLHLDLLVQSKVAIICLCNK